MYGFNKDGCRRHGAGSRESSLKTDCQNSNRSENDICLGGRAEV